MDLRFLMSGLKNGDQLSQAYERDKKNCEGAGELESDCDKQVNLKYLRQFPGLKNTVYPWSNYDWDYKTLIDNKFNTQKTGVTKAGTFGALLVDNPDGATKIAKGFVFDANPTKDSKSAYTDAPGCFSKLDQPYECRQNDAVSKIRQSYSAATQAPPYPDPFFTKHPLDGTNSSSYYIRTGVCPKPNMDEAECKRKGWAWVENPIVQAMPADIQPSDAIPGSCFKPKYGFVKNPPGLKVDFTAMNEMIDLLEKVGTAGAGTVGSIAGSQVGMGGAGGAAAGGSVQLATNIMNKIRDKGEDFFNVMLRDFKGEIPSLVNAIQSLSPADVYVAAKGGTLPLFDNMDCNEGFGMPKLQPNMAKTVYQVILVVLLVVIILVVLNNFGKLNRIRH